MFVCLGTYTRPLGPDDAALVASHRAYLDGHYVTGALVASGPREPRVGGLVVLSTSEPNVARELIDGDPFVVAGVASYELHRFTATKAILPELVEPDPGGGGR